ncbi:chitinase [Paraburkholderia sediminicola]|uniref:chitinase n=1 Tax=Paraburkholderia sediminicola TaxID=458836 RepID=UPI0038BB5E11
MANTTPPNPPGTPLKQPGFAFPFRKKAQGSAGSSADFTDEHDFHKVLKQEPSGSYPVSGKGMWHGGIHVTEAGAGRSLDLGYGVRCIADGDVVAWRVDRAYPVSEVLAQDDKPAIGAAYSTGFALVRHSMEFPRGTTLKFFSLYMHLQDIAGYESDTSQPRPAYWSTQFKVTEFARDKPHPGPNGQVAPAEQQGLRIRATRPHGTVLGILPQGAQVSIGKRDGNWGQLKETYGAQLFAPTTGGLVAANAASGWVFLGRENGGPVVEEIMPDSSLDRVVVPSTPVHIDAGALIGHLGRYDSLSQQTSNRMVHIEVFCDDSIKSFMEQGRTWIGNNGAHPDRWRQLGLPSDPTILRVDKKTTLYGLAEHQGQDAKQTGVILATVLAELAKHCEQHVETQPGPDGLKLHWWHVDSADVQGNAIDGWVREQSFAGGRVTREFAQKWVDFQTLEDAHDPTHTMFATTKAFVDYAIGADVPERGAFGKLSPLMQSIYQAAYPTGDSSHAADRLCDAAEHPWITLRTSRLIVKHESEWANPDKWKQLIAEIETRTGPQAQHKAEQERIERLVWWDDVKSQLNDLPRSDVFHMHPIGVVGNFATGIGCIPLEKAKELALLITSGFEGSHPMDFGATADNSDGQGMSFGVIQWCVGQGVLGPLLDRMRNADPVAFKSSFDESSNYAVLESAISNGNQQALYDWAVNQQSHNSNWRSAFTKLGQVQKFQKIQIDEATSRYHQGVMQCLQFLRSISPDLINNIELVTYCAFYDLAVQQNNLRPAVEQIRTRIAAEHPATQRELVKIAVEERAKKANHQYVSDCMSRRIGILQQSMFTYTAYGVTKHRPNLNFHVISKDASTHVCGL